MTLSFFCIYDDFILCTLNGTFIYLRKMMSYDTEDEKHCQQHVKLY